MILYTQILGFSFFSYYLHLWQSKLFSQVKSQGGALSTFFYGILKWDLYLHIKIIVVTKI